MARRLKDPADWKTDILHCLEEVKRLAGAHSEARMNRRPEEGTWSAAECIRHLNLTAALMAPKLEAAIRKAKERGLEGEPPFSTGWLGSWFLDGSGPGARPLPVPGRYRPEGSRDDAPSSSLDVARTVAEFDELQQRWLDLIEEGRGLQLDAVRAPSPVIPILRLNVATWIEGMPGHQMRHLKQMRRALGDSGEGEG
ncbi:MAG: DinB family protein [Gemmatimonadales bacterium]|nr:MAG: DinB family protein [Gemmatimonadales bacterium]